MLKNLCLKHMRELRNGMFATNPRGRDGISQAHFMIERMACAEEKIVAYTALHVAVNSIVKEVIDFIEEDFEA